MTRAQKALLVELATEPLDCVSIQDALANFDRRLQNLDDIQMELEIALDPDKVDINADIEQAAKLRMEIKKIRIRASHVLDELETEHHSKGLPFDTLHTSQEQKPDVKLPKLVLSKLSGDVLLW